MSTTSIPHSVDSASAFPVMPIFPSIRSTVPLDFKPVVRRPPPILNKIYFNKKVLFTMSKTLNSDTGPTLHKIWEIPFSCDVEVPVADLTQRIYAAMNKTGQYIHWDVDFSHFIIRAVEK